MHFMAKYVRIIKVKTMQGHVTVTQDYIVLCKNCYHPSLKCFSCCRLAATDFSSYLFFTQEEFKRYTPNMEQNPFRY